MHTCTPPSLKREKDIHYENLINEAKYALNKAQRQNLQIDEKIRLSIKMNELAFSEIPEIWNLDHEAQRLKIEVINTIPELLEQSERADLTVEAKITLISTMILLTKCFFSNPEARKLQNKAQRLEEAAQRLTTEVKNSITELLQQSERTDLTIEDKITLASNMILLTNGLSSDLDLENKDKLEKTAFRLQEAAEYEQTANQIESWLRVSSTGQRMFENRENHDFQIIQTGSNDENLDTSSCNSQISALESKRARSNRSLIDQVNTKPKVLQDISIIRSKSKSI